MFLIFPSWSVAPHEVLKLRRSAVTPGTDERVQPKFEPMGLSGPKRWRPILGQWVYKNLQSIPTTLWTTVRVRTICKCVHTGCCRFQSLGCWGLSMNPNHNQKLSTGDPPAHNDVRCGPRSGAHSKFSLLGPVCPFGRVCPEGLWGSLSSAPFHPFFKYVTYFHRNAIK